MAAHLHRLSICIVSIEQVQAIIQQKRMTSLRLSDRAYETIDEYYEFIKEQLMIKVDEEKDKTCRLIEKLVYQLDENSEEISTTINSFEQREFQKVPKEATVKLLTSLQKDEEESTTEKKFESLCTEIE